MVALVAREGRELQRYNTQGRRLIVGCIPYRFKFMPCDNCVEEAMEVLMISPQSGKGYIFPKGGWELDETIEEAVERESMEEAGVGGEVQTKLDTYEVRSKSQGNVVHECHVFPLLVTQEYEDWPEKQARMRHWITVAEARESCQRAWMKDSLDKLVKKLETNCSDSRLDYLMDVAVSRGSMQFDPCHRCPNSVPILPNFHLYHLQDEHQYYRSSTFRLIPLVGVQQMVALDSLSLNCLTSNQPLHGGLLEECSQLML